MNQKRRYASGWLLQTLVVGALVACLAVTIAVWGRTETTYFSPDSLKCKTVTRYRIPGTDMRMFRWSEVDCTPPLLKYLRRSGFVEEPLSGAERWHYLEGPGIGPGEWHGEPRYFVRMNGDKLIQWSEDNPEHAQILWPLAIDLARSMPYIYAEQFVRLGVAISDLPPDEYEKELNIQHSVTRGIGK